MPNLKWMPPAALSARTEPLEVRAGGVIYTLSPGRDGAQYIEPEHVAAVTAAVIAAIPGSTVSVSATGL